MSRIGDRHEFSFNHDSNPREHPNRPKPAESSKQKPNFEPRPTKHPDAALDVAGPNQAPLRRIVESLGILYIIACIIFEEVAAIFITAKFRLVFTKTNEYLHAAAECVWYYVLACTALIFLVTTSFEVVAIVWATKFYIFGAAAGCYVNVKVYNAGRQRAVRENARALLRMDEQGLLIL
jgi:hypothetical protein